jgi:hypothetical protein
MSLVGADKDVKNKFLLIITLISLLCLAGWTGHAAKYSPQPPVWEYKVLEANWDEKQLNNLGTEGWELVAVDASRGDFVRAFFKRRK